VIGIDVDWYCDFGFWVLMVVIELNGWLVVSMLISFCICLLLCVVYVSVNMNGFDMFMIVNGILVLFVSVCWFCMLVM